MLEVFRPGDRVLVVRSHEGLGSRLGTVVEVEPARGGCLVMPDGVRGSYGWGFEELRLLPGVGQTWQSKAWPHVVVVTRVTPTTVFAETRTPRAEYRFGVREFAESFAPVRRSRWQLVSEAER